MEARRHDAPPGGPDAAAAGAASRRPLFMVDRVTEMVMMTLVLIGVVIIAVKVFGPIARAWARKLEGKVGDPQIHADLDQMRDQLGEVDSLRTRVAELEERIEFTERLLAQRKDQDLLPRREGSR